MIRGGTCPRCRTGEVLAVLRLPRSWTNTSGSLVRGTRDVLLCAACDADDPLAGPVVTYFAVHGRARPQDAALLAACLLRWIAGARPAEPDERALRAEADAWRRGDL
uniref:DUF6300 family protein n=1 Tax=Nonomuraea pusilla TaxID=46177 RepID=UPI0006E19E1C|nr:DUF6300 family protein [Nonomuraea pusilla]